MEDWFAAGERIMVIPAKEDDSTHSDGFHIFCQIVGTGSWLTFLHGFPTCSWDWVKLVDKLKVHYRLLMFDFLGFGDSDKPRDHQYSLFEQADFTEAIWRHLGVEKTGLVAHDYGDTVALELLCRQKEGRLRTNIERVVMLNGGIYVDYIQPLRIQKLLQKPLFGAMISRILSERMFKKRFTSIFSRLHPISDSELSQHWHAIKRHKGVRNYHKLIQYLSERQKFKARWESTLATCDIPIRFIWGLGDPVSGRNISEQIRKHLPQADLLELPDVGHYPQLEVPDWVVEQLLRTFHKTKSD
ncbi:MAG: alpha/beta fold hydrolase [bacterium]